jgi:UDP-N-acetylglucosamine 2-epimerase
LDIVRQYNDAHVVYPVHLNPNVQEPVHRLLGNHDQITLLPPLDYLPLVHLMKRSHVVLTDSGGIQEEAPGLGKPVLVLRSAKCADDRAARSGGGWYSAVGGHRSRANSARGEAVVGRR